MRLIIRNNVFDEEVIGEPFDIEGSPEKFAVHAAIGLDAGMFAATHLGTGLKVAMAETIDGAIHMARERWQSKTPEEITERIAIARTELGPPGFRVIEASNVAGSASSSKEQG